MRLPNVHVQHNAYAQSPQNQGQFQQAQRGGYRGVRVNYQPTPKQFKNRIGNQQQHQGYGSNQRYGGALPNYSHQRMATPQQQRFQQQNFQQQGFPRQGFQQQSFAPQQRPPQEQRSAANPAHTQTAQQPQGVGQTAPKPANRASAHPAPTKPAVKQQLGIWDRIKLVFSRKGDSSASTKAPSTNKNVFSKLLAKFTASSSPKPAAEQQPAPQTTPPQTKSQLRPQPQAQPRPVAQPRPQASQQRPPQQHGFPSRPQPMQRSNASSRQPLPQRSSNQTTQFRRAQNQGGPPPRPQNTPNRVKTGFWAKQGGAIPGWNPNAKASSRPAPSGLVAQRPPSDYTAAIKAGNFKNYGSVVTPQLEKWDKIKHQGPSLRYTAKAGLPRFITKGKSTDIDMFYNTIPLKAQAQASQQGMLSITAQGTRIVREDIGDKLEILENLAALVAAHNDGKERPFSRFATSGRRVTAEIQNEQQLNAEIDRHAIMCRDILAQREAAWLANLG